MLRSYVTNKLVGRGAAFLTTAASAGVFGLTDAGNFLDVLDDFFTVTLFLGLFGVSLAAAPLFMMISASEKRRGDNIADNELSVFIGQKSQELKNSSHTFLSAGFPCLLGIIACTMFDAFDTEEAKNVINFTWTALFEGTGVSFSDEFFESVVGLGALGWILVLLAWGYRSASIGLTPDPSAKYEPGSFTLES